MKSNSTQNQSQNITTTQAQTQNTNNISLPQQPPNQNQDFKTLIDEIKELNNICNIKNMINLIRELKTKLAQDTTPFKKIYILQEISEKYQI